MIEFAFAIVFFGARISLGVYLNRWQFRKADALIESWAERSHFRIVAKEPANPLGTGPKAMRAANKQVMYRVVVQDTQGHERRALVKVGSESTGVLSENLVVVWDHE